MMLANKLQTILAARGKTADFTRDVRVQDDGAGPYIKHWDEEKLGLRPTQEEIDLVDITKIQHNNNIDRQITALENTKPGYVRGIREFMLGIALIVKEDGGPDLMQTPGMKNVKDLDDAIKALRSQRLP